MQAEKQKLSIEEEIEQLKKIGSAVVSCPDCGDPLSFRDETPFCRSCVSFNERRPEVRQALVRPMHMSREQVRECLRRR